MTKVGNPHFALNVGNPHYSPPPLVWLSGDATVSQVGLVATNTFCFGNFFEALTVFIILCIKASGFRLLRLLLTRRGTKRVSAAWRARSGWKRGNPVNLIPEIMKTVSAVKK